MSKIETGVAELRRSFDRSLYPGDFLEQYVQLECLAHSHGTETFLVRSKNNEALYVAKCYDKSVFTVINENEILMCLHHDGLPVYVAAFEGDMVSVTVREYVEGTPLDRYAEENDITEKQAVGFCVQLCDILAYLHSREKPIIHRDIKPQNIIVKPDKTISLIDFDIARQYSDDAETDTQFFGTRVYAPPEQYGFSQTDCRTDIYSLGVLLRFLLTGSEKERKDKPESKQLHRVIDRCAAFSPKDRYASVEAVKAALLHSDGKRERIVARFLFFALTAFAFLCAGFTIGRFTDFLVPAAVAETVAFKEPLIEAAARAQLGKTGEEPITAEELKTVTALYIFGMDVSSKKDAFANGLSNNNSAGYVRGNILSLSDLALMPNIEELEIGYQPLSDLSGIEKLEYLKAVNFMHTWVSDVSPLAGLHYLESAQLFDTKVADISALDACPRLSYLELGLTPVATLDVPGGSESVEVLSLKFLELASLDGIGRFPRLETLLLSQARLTDMDALRTLPSLKTIVADAKLAEKLSALLHETNIEIIIE